MLAIQQAYNRVGAHEHNIAMFEICTNMFESVGVAQLSIHTTIQTKKMVKDKMHNNRNYSIHSKAFLCLILCHCYATKLIGPLCMP